MAHAGHVSHTNGHHADGTPGEQAVTDPSIDDTFPSSDQKFQTNETAAGQETVAVQPANTQTPIASLNSEPAASLAAAFSPAGSNAPDFANAARRPGRLRRGVSFLWTALVLTPLRLISLVVLLALLSVIPVLQLAALGYLFEVSGRLGRGGKWRDCLPALQPAGRLGLALLALFVVALPIRLVSYWSYTAELIATGNPQARLLELSALGLVFLGVLWLAWAWMRGGRPRHYLWPQPIRFAREIWRPRTWQQAADQLWNFAAAFGLPRLWWLGTRGALASLVWITPPALLIIGATREGETGLAGLVGVIGMAMMGFVVMYLPMLQAQFAAENRWRAMFGWRQIRAGFRAAPFAFWWGTVMTLVLAVPLYLLKIEATPKEVVWAPAMLFIAFMLPAHILTGWAFGRSRRRDPGRRWWHRLLRITVRAASLPFVLAYLLFVYVSQLTSWDGLVTWFNQHAFLVPVPFVGT